ncbi:MAG: sel1 repeat family protein [Candidatus Nitronauta litoralis]|uniref:Sel1 repeat family protein n=1 Tax=Candidatus Nitronauta litoralis TaxID=2705533 RepID=A0A7T0G0D0_9BACT|nr:MAG: sel1 repeat family protein [Candidatus Nitronauta litoralis]
MNIKGFSRTLNIVAILIILIGHGPSRVYGESLQDPFLKGWSEYENKNFDLALKTWLPLAERGNPDAQYFVGIFFSKGLGVPVNFKEAGKWFQKSADQGDVGAQYQLGIFFETGKGYPRDLHQAGYWFKKAAKQGYPDAQYHLGRWYSKINGAKQDFVLSYVWLSLAEANGIQTARPKINAVKKQLTPEQLTKASQLAHKLWLQLEER